MHLFIFILHFYGFISSRKKLAQNLRTVKMSQSVCRFYLLCTRYLLKEHNFSSWSFFSNSINDTHRKKLCFTQFSKRLLKQKLGDFWPFSCLHNQVSSIHSIATYQSLQMFAKGDSSNSQLKWTAVLFSKCYTKFYVG